MQPDGASSSQLEIKHIILSLFSHSIHCLFLLGNTLFHYKNKLLWKLAEMLRIFFHLFFVVGFFCLVSFFHRILLDEARPGSEPATPLVFPYRYLTISSKLSEFSNLFLVSEKKFLRLEVEIKKFMNHFKNLASSRTMLETLNLSSIRPARCLDEQPPRNSSCCWHGFEYRCC